MTTSVASRPEVFTRKASGLVRVMSPFSAFVYNILTMGLIFPWTYLWAPGALPGGKMVWGILLAMVIEIPIAFVYVWLSTALPRPGWVEQNPHDIVRTVKEAVAPLLENYDIAAVGFDNQGETFIVWDKDTGEPVTPAIVWQDTRGESVCKALALRLAQDTASNVDPNLLRQKTGLLLDSYFSAPKLKWVFENNPEIRKKAHEGKLKFGTTETWVIWSLTKGKLHVTDSSTASRTLLFDMNKFEWDDELLALFDVPRSMLPEVKPSAGYIGDVDFGGKGKPLPLHALLVDQQAALFGQACFKAGEMKCSFGTGSFLLIRTYARRI